MFWVAFKLSYANAFQLTKPKIVSSVKGLRVKDQANKQYDRKTVQAEKKQNHPLFTCEGFLSFLNNLDLNSFPNNPVFQ